MKHRVSEALPILGEGADRYSDGPYTHAHQIAC